jgi:hypothetical protein
MPEDCAADLRRFSRELRTRQPGGPDAAPEWRRLSPSAELLIDPECQARGIIRDTRARGADRFHWSVLAPDQSHTVAAGHTGRIARGRWLAETALRAFIEDWASNPAGRAAMIDGLPQRLFWRVIDALDYLVTLAWLRILDALAGPLPKTPAD